MTEHQQLCCLVETRHRDCLVSEIATTRSFVYGKCSLWCQLL